MDNTRDLDRSFERLNRAEEFRSRATGYGTTQQGQALTRQYQGVLAERIGADRAHPHDRKPWRVLKDIDDETLALRLLVAGISVCDSDTSYSANGLKVVLSPAYLIFGVPLARLPIFAPGIPIGTSRHTRLQIK
jgi:hypothetical protein